MGLQAKAQFCIARKGKKAQELGNCEESRHRFSCRSLATFQRSKMVRVLTFLQRRQP